MSFSQGFSYKLRLWFIETSEQNTNFSIAKYMLLTEIETEQEHENKKQQNSSKNVI